MKYRTDGENDKLTGDPGKYGHDTREPAPAPPRRPAKAVLDESGCIQVPEDVLCAWSAEPGDELIVRLEGGELRVLTRRAGLALARRIVRRYVEPGDSLADELIRERRRETARRNG